MMEELSIDILPKTWTLGIELCVEKLRKEVWRLET